MKKKHRMTIAVLCHDTGEVDIISVPVKLIRKYGDVENFLSEYCQYYLDNISWMFDRKAMNEELPGGGIGINFLTEDSFDNE